MSENYLHGTRVIEAESSTQPISAAHSGVIGIVGTAPEADEEVFPLDVPVLILGSQKKAASLGALGTLPQSIEAIFKQIGAMIVVVRVKDEEKAADTKANVIGGIDDETGSGTGILALLEAETTVKVKPSILISPGFSNQQSVGNQLASVADKLRAYALLDGPNTTDANAITYREKFGSRRCEIIDPWYKVFDTETKSEVIRPPSPYHAGVMAKVHTEKGFWHSNSNKEIYGINGLTRAITFSSDSETSTANYLNSKHVTTTILQDGYRTWGNRTCSSEPRWTFKTAVITNDKIAESLVKSFLWATDRNITRAFGESIVGNVNRFLDNLTTKGAIAGGKCWIDPERNTADQISQGKFYLNYDFSPHGPAEQIIIESEMVDGYLTEIF